MPGPFLKIKPALDTCSALAAVSAPVRLETGNFGVLIRQYVSFFYTYILSVRLGTPVYPSITWLKPATYHNKNIN